ncbi:MAG: hypothetical protein RIR97_25 [Pseudomonadota bacterium]
MSISPVSDLVLDVVQAADPAKVIEAQSRLKSAKTQTEAVQLASAGKGFEASVVKAQDMRALKMAETNSVDDKKTETYRNFEAMVLQNFVQSMMPADTESVYGEGTTGDYWKSMMAEQIAKEIAAGGGIGIADHLLNGKDKATSAGADVLALSSAPPLHLPTGEGSADRLIQQTQMKTLDHFLPGDHSENKK